MDNLIVLDLDNTIFDTRAITKESVNAIVTKFKSMAVKAYGSRLTNQIISEFWKFPFDVIAETYQLDDRIKQELDQTISQESFTFNIKPFNDFKVFKDIGFEKILVTTGFKKLQRAKIESLGIKNMFSGIYIDDILSPNRIFKKGIFKNILEEKQAKQDQVYIIGDHPQSELKAGLELGLTTIQVSKFGQKRSAYADFMISDFNELIEIFNSSMY